MAPITKNSSPQPLTARGMTPIEKNIIVVDEQGKEYEATYPKRAKGLVKHGRARFISENTICLACPPKKDLEDYIMSDLNMTAHTDNTEVEYSIPYILKQIAAIQQETGYLYSTISNLAAMSEGDSGDSGAPGNLMGQAKADALGRVVCAREATNQQMLRMYEKMYDSLNPNPPQMFQPMDWMRNMGNHMGGMQGGPSHSTD